MYNKYQMTPTVAVEGPGGIHGDIVQAGNV